MNEPTVDGLTPEQLFDLCSKSAHREAKEQIAASALPRPLTQIEGMMLDLGVMTAVRATWDELARRDLIKERP